MLRLPPITALRAAGLVLALLVAGLLVVALTLGASAVLMTSLGAVAGAPLALVRTGATLRVGFGLLLGAAAVAGVLATDHPLVAAGVVLALGLAQVFFHVPAAGTAAMLPAVAAVCASVPLTDDAAAAGAQVALGYVLVLGIAAALGLMADPEPLGRSLALRHAVVSALATAVVIFFVLRIDISHGYWTVLAVAQVLQPRAHETRDAARARVAGTLAGAAVAVAAVVLLPASILLIAAAACFALVVAWAFVGDLGHQAGYSTAALVLLGSSGLTGAGVETALTRLLLFGAGAAVALALSELLLRADRR